jgi:general L-amino acid transport system permease protein
MVTSHKKTTVHQNAPTTAPPRQFNWNDAGVRAVAYQVIAIALVAFVAWFLVSNTLHNLSARNIATGFGFLGREAGFAIGETAISYSFSDTYGRAILVGMLNTLRVAVFSIVLATLVGTLVGIGRLSRNWLVAKLTSLYVEVMRNIPLLLQLFFWYALITENMPGPREALHPLPGIFISNRGLKMPSLEGNALDWMTSGLALAIVAIIYLAHWGKKRQDVTGQIFPLGRVGLGLIIMLPLIGWLVSGGSLTLNMPEFKGFNFTGGLTLSPEFSALLAGLVIYTSAFIAEVVRSGILAVNSGQWEAASALGLRRGLVLRLVVLPQALRVIIPPLTSQYLNLTKNSSLALAIGYPDIVAVVNTTLNQTGQAIEGILIIMGVYLVVSLSISLFMNWYNRRMALVER